VEGDISRQTAAHSAPGATLQPAPERDRRDGSANTPSRTSCRTVPATVGCERSPRMKAPSSTGDQNEVPHRAVHFPEHAEHFPEHAERPAIEEQHGSTPTGPGTHQDIHLPAPAECTGPGNCESPTESTDPGQSPERAERTGPRRLPLRAESTDPGNGRNPSATHSRRTHDRDILNSATASGVSQERLYISRAWPPARKNARFPGRLWTEVSLRRGS